MKVWQLILFGVLVHLVLFYSIFDIYFTSPLVHGMTPVSPPTRKPAKRLVLFVTDGLRADKFFELDEDGKTRAPYLRDVIEHRGVWGISHTRVPTESRPGHVALIAGFYEDVSAVAKGWKENPVEFDSVFNESRHTWSWGSPDILPMFAKGASGDHVSTSCYPADLEDFAGSDMTRLDTWVFDQVEEFLKSASLNESLSAELKRDKIVFFLHLLGIDTHGHSNKPHSKEYLNNIKLVDKGISKMVSTFRDFYQDDGETAFVMTADHGMTDWGSHGAGHAQETLTPFVAWGAGVRSPVKSANCGVYTDSFCADWKLEDVQRSDMEQADVATLMSHLVGIPFPVNSVGRLPVDILNASRGEKAEALLANAEQILAQFQVKMDQIKDRTIAATFRPFQELIEAEKLQSLKHIRKLIHGGQYEDAVSETHLLIDKALQGLRYYQTYDRVFLGISVVFGFLGWVCYVLYLVVLEHTAVGQASARITAGHSEGHTRLLLFGSMALIICILLAVQSLHMMCYVYCLMPVLLWYKACQGLRLLQYTVRWTLANRQLGRFVLSVVVSAAGLEIIVLSFYYRQLLSVGLLAMSLWPIIQSRGQGRVMGRPWIAVGWSLTCTLVGMFPLMPVVGRETRYALVTSSGLLAVFIGALILYRVSFSRHFKILCGFQLMLIAVSVLTVKLTSESIADRQGLPWFCQLCSWLVLGCCLPVALFSPTCLRDRLLSLSAALLAPYILLSITYEGMFILSLLALLYFWLQMEHTESLVARRQVFQNVDFKQDGLIKDDISSATFSRHLELSDLRRAFYFIFLILTAFFGTGNIASINSFDPASVYCFLTVFNPFLMGALMMLKNMIPFLLVTCAFRGVQVLTHTPLRSLFLIVLIMSDFMGLHFFFLVRDYGSWLEIGSSISHYVIVMVMIIFLLLLTGVSHVLTCWRVPLPTQRHKML
ncbi:GPI ethanolamine phosphate transferase 1 [Aplysia californica]|uniref:GPI ethanolamine phosphate transferase 1 n=1 Tax=Aplysia californica TaxID=6500 RepID=A0ABM0JVP3_APLCA|nr:GPI ethanolamine phosphate transferase 1 [Aplysia californica]